MNINDFVETLPSRRERKKERKKEREKERERKYKRKGGAGCRGGGHTENDFSHERGRQSLF